ncbi:Late embryogenesis abundant protein [Thalictrum thalictroides]|uniref:Late embryogenesis abundant protein n=1 Tax=Thalictrum thalictroides TaxID=46969 RepID=A0A7J6WH59_THATH|nr:Late embryogenesis abundant protein [Thalictrum thalictroides]
MSTSRQENDPNKPVTGYPYPPPSMAAQPNNYPTPPPPEHQFHYHQQQQSHTGTAYPYTVPPPANYYYNNPNNNPYPPQPYYDPQRATLFRRLIIAMIAVFILFGVITFIMWLVLRPHVPDFQIESASVTGFNTSVPSQFTANWDVGFFVRNPNNKMTILYERLDGYVYYHNEQLSEIGIAPFVQNTKSETRFRAKFAAPGTYVNGDLINQMTAERNRGRVNFNLKIMGWIRFRSGSWKTRMRMMRVICEDVTIVFSANSGGVGTMSGGPKKCDVDL